MSEPVGLAYMPSRGGWPRFAVRRAVWVPCPGGFPAGDDQDSWARRYAARWWVRSGTDPDNRQVAELAKILSDVREATYRPGTCHVAMIHLPPGTPVLQPLAVAIGVWHLQGEREARLRRLVCADDMHVIEPPAVEEFWTEALGAGLRSVRYARDDEGSLYGAACYAFRVGRYQTDLRFSAAGPDVRRLQAAMPDIEELVRSTTIVPLTGEASEPRPVHENCAAGQ